MLCLFWVIFHILSSQNAFSLFGLITISGMLFFLLIVLIAFGAGFIYGDRNKLALAYVGKLKPFTQN